MLGWFKKKKDEEVKRHYDPGNVRLFQMRKGSFIDYDFKTWEVRAWYEYDWGNDYFTDEFQLNDGSETVNLYVAMNGEDAECSISTPIRLRELDGDVADYIKRHDTAPPEVLYKDEKYFKEYEEPGYFRNTDTDGDNWAEFISWTYYNETGDKLVVVERWDEDVFEASAGYIVKEAEFTNIIMP